MPQEAAPTRVRFFVLAGLCSLAFLTYLDRICIMRAQGDIARDLRFTELTEHDRATLAAGEHDGYKEILKPEDLLTLKVDDKSDDVDARLAVATERLETQRRTNRMAWIFFAFLAGYALFELPGGWLGDRWGARLVIVRIVIWWSIFTALTGCVDTVLMRWVSSPSVPLAFALMFAVRFLFGIGEAGAYPNVGRALGRWFPYHERAKAQGVIWMVSRCGGALSPAIIGWLMLWLDGWREAFIALGVVGIAWALLFRTLFRDRPEDATSVNEAERELIRGGKAAKGSIYDDHDMSGAPWGKLLCSPNLWALYVAAATVSFSWYVNVTFLPQVLKDRFGLDFSQSAWLTGMPLLVSAFSCLASGILSDHLIRKTGSRRWGRSLPGIVGLSGAGICLLLFPQAPSAVAAVSLLCVACALQDLAVPCIWAVCADIGGRHAGTVAGAMNAGGGIGAMLSPLVAASLKNSFGWDTAFLVFAASYFVSAAMWLRIDATESLVEKNS